MVPLTALPDLSRQIRQLRAGCIGDGRQVLDLRRNAAYWLSARAGLPPTLSSFYVDPAEASLSAAVCDSAPGLAALGYLLDAGGQPSFARAHVETALDIVLTRAARTTERTGYADDPLVLAGLSVLAKRLGRAEAVARLQEAARSRPGVLTITLALPLIAATGVRPRVAAPDCAHVGQIAAVVLASLIPESQCGALLPANAIAAAPGRLVLEASLDRLSDSSDFENMIVLAALEAIVASQARVPQPAVTKEKQCGADFVFLVALREEFRTLFELIGEPDSTEREHCIYYAFECGDYHCQATLVGEPGIEAALIATDRAIRHWRPRAIVFIGIAGGIHADVQLGDVVVASQVDLYMANTKAVDAEAGFELQHAGRAFHVDHALLQRVRNFEFSHATAFKNWRRTCRAELERDVPDGTNFSLSAVRALPALLDGHIASGPSVVTSQPFVEWLRKRDRKYLAAEMEGGGAAFASTSRPAPVPVLVIRGISDHADAAKASLDSVGEGVFRSYAMRNAVRLALEVLAAGGLFTPGA